MDNNTRIFHSEFYVAGYSKHDEEKYNGYFGKCTFVCRRTTPTSIDVAVAFCHEKDTFKKKEGIKVANTNLESGAFITLPINKSITGCDLNDVIRDFMTRYSKSDYRHLTFGTVPNIPIKNWERIEFYRRPEYQPVSMRAQRPRRFI